MKTKYIVLLTLCMLTLHQTSIFSQIATIQHKDQIEIEKAVFYPVLNEFGNKVLYSDENYNRLEMVDLQTKTTTIISAEQGAGFDPLFEKGSDKIIYRKTTCVNGRKLQSLNLFDCEKQIRHEILSFTRNLQTTHPPQAATSSLLRSATLSGIKVYSNAQSIIVNENGKEKKLKPFSENEVTGYIWATLSPDKNRILFYAVGKGTYIADLNGKIRASLGDVQAPQWFGKNYVMGMQAKSNEFTYTASRILIVQTDGEKKQYLTDENEIAMYPTAAYDVNKIAYNTSDGKLYLLTLKLHKK